MTRRTTKTEAGQGFTVEQVDLLRHLKLAKSVASKNSTMPALGMVKVAALGDILEIQATDLNVSDTTTGPITGTVGQLEVTLQAGAFADLVGKLRSGPMRIEQIADGWVSVTQQKSVFKIPTGVNPRDYPKVMAMPEESAELEAPTFLAMIERTVFSVCKDETRFHLNGCYLECDGDVATMVSTDGHRLSLARATLALTLPSSAGVIIPLKGLLEMRKLLAEVKVCRVGFGKGAIVVAVDGALLGVRLIDAQFPPYQQVIPPETGNVITTNRVGLLEAIGRVRLMSSENRGVGLVAADGTLSIACQHSDLGSASDEVAADIEGRPPGLLAVNPRYLVEILERLSGDQVEICVGGELDPVLCRSQGDPTMIGVIMPMRA